MSEKDTTITADGLAQMLEQFQSSANLRLLASSYLDQIQAFEDAAWPLLGERSIDNATGHRLDGLGVIFNIPRSGRSDTDYRLRLKAEALILASTGTAEDLLTIAQALVQMPTADYELTEYFPKGLVIRPVDYAVTSGADVIGKGLKRASSAGTTTHFVYSLRDDANTFTLSSQGAVSETSSSLGLGPVPTNEGQWLFDTGTELSGLSAGYYRINSATPQSVTEVYVHDDDFFATDQSAWLATLTGEPISLLRSDARLVLHVHTATDNGGTFTLGVYLGDASGTFDQNDPFVFYGSASGGQLSGVS